MNYDMFNEPKQYTFIDWKDFPKTISSHGYIMVKFKQHPYCNKSGYVYEHRLIMEHELGRYLTSKELVHHKDENRKNNEISNLKLEESIAHHKLEHRNPNSKLKNPDEENPLISCLCGCGKIYRKFDKHGRLRSLFSPGHSNKIGSKRYIIENILCACGCGALINKYDRYGRERKFIAGHNRSNEINKTQLAKKTGFCYQTIINYFNGIKLRESTIIKIENIINNG
jgi:hypothetical protein